MEPPNYESVRKKMFDSSIALETMSSDDRFRNLCGEKWIECGAMKTRKLKTFLVILLLLPLFLLIINIFHKYVLESSISRYKLVKLKNNKNDTKIIVFWTNFFGIPYWGMPAETNREDYLILNNCPVTNCILTHNKNYLESPHLYDAVVFHGAQNWLMLDLPKIRSPHQLYILSTLEWDFWIF